MGAMQGKDQKIRTRTDTGMCCLVSKAMFNDGFGLPGGLKLCSH